MDTFINSRPSHPDGIARNGPQRERQAALLDQATRFLADAGADTVTLDAVAVGLQTGAAQLRRHFCEVHALRAAILHRHLLKISHALRAVPLRAENRSAKLRGAYLAQALTAKGEPNPAHLMLVRDRHRLPAWLRADVQAMRLGLGYILDASDPEAMLDRLDAIALGGAPECARRAAAAPDFISPPGIEAPAARPCH